MATTGERDVRRFAAEFPTPNVRRLIAAAEAGEITWAEAAEVARKALAAALADAAR